MQLSKVERLVLTLLLSAIEAVQLNITMSSQAHAGLSMIIVVFVGMHIIPATPVIIRSQLPPAVITVASAVIGAVLILQQAFTIGAFWHTVIGVVLVIVTAFGIAPSALPAWAGGAPQSSAP